MVTITGYQPKEKDGKTFFAITLQGDVRFAQSETTGNFYLTSDKASVTTSFNEIMCQMLIGKQLAGSIKKVECEPYTTENGTFTHRFQYSPKEEASVVQSAMPIMQLQMPKQLQGVPFELMNTFTGEMAAA